MDEQDWLLIKTLFEKKSITKAASALFVSQPALSSRLQQIEARFGAKIVVRSKKGVQFTPEGEYLVAGARDILKKMQVVEENIQNMCDQATGTLRIGASNFATKYLLPELLRRFKEMHPRIEFKVTTGWSKDIVNLVYNNDVHIGFVRGEYSWPGEQELLFEEKMYVSHKQNIALMDLPHLPRISYRNDYSIQLLLDKWWNEKFLAPPRIGMEVDKVDTCKEMVSKGLGYGFLPGMILKHHDELHNIEMRYRNGKPMLRRTWLFYHKETMELNLVRAFNDFIQRVDFNEL
jgi:DNA-binding transcriptional LysR family regulator